MFALLPNNSIQFYSVCNFWFIREQVYGNERAFEKERERTRFFECMGLRKHLFPVIVTPRCDFLSADIDCAGWCCQVFLTLFLSETFFHTHTHSLPTSASLIRSLISSFIFRRCMSYVAISYTLSIHFIRMLYRLVEVILAVSAP